MGIGSLENWDLEKLNTFLRPSVSLELEPSILSPDSVLLTSKSLLFLLSLEKGVSVYHLV